MIDALLDNARFSLRQLSRSPGFFLGATLILAIATGGLVSTGAAAWSILFKSLPYDNPDELAVLTVHSRELGWNMSLSPLMVEELRDDDWQVSVAAYQRGRAVDDDQGRQWRIAAIEPELAGLLGISPLLGRHLSSEDADANDAVVISQTAWHSRFGANPDVLGQRIELDGQSRHIVGVMPPSLNVPEPAIEAWMPLAFNAEQLAPDAIGHVGTLDAVVARLAPGQTTVSAVTALNARFGDDPRLARMRDNIGLEFKARSLRQTWADQQRRPLALLVAATAAIFFIAVLNLAGLWMARWLKRGRETAVHSALGAGRWQPLKTTAVELAWVVVVGLALGLIAAEAVTQALYMLDVLDRANPLDVDLGQAGLMLGLGLAAMAAVPVLLSVSWQTRGLFANPAKALGSESRGIQGVGRRSRSSLLVGQIALATTLLAVTGLLVMSWMNLLGEDLGFEPDNLAMVQLRPGPDISDPSAPDEQVTAALEAISALPGIGPTAFAQIAPFSWGEIVSTYVPPGRPDSTAPMRPRHVSPEYFSTIGTDIVAGHIPDPGEAGAGTIQVVVDEFFVQRHFPKSEAIGQRFGYGSGPDGKISEVEIAAVARSTRHMAPNEEIKMPTVYFIQDKPRSHYQLLARTKVPAGQVLTLIRSLLEQELGPDRVAEVETAKNRIESTVADRRPQLILLGAITVLATILVAIGLYALMSYSARTRIPELGLRLALGSAPTRNGLSILLDGLKLLLVGLIPGLVMAWLGAQLVAERLYQVSVWQPILWAGVIGLLTIIVLLAGLRPALLAMRVEPMDALRQE